MKKFAVAIYDMNYDTNVVYLVLGSTEEEAIINAAIEDLKENENAFGKPEPGFDDDAKEFLINHSNDEMGELLSALEKRFGYNVSLPVVIEHLPDGPEDFEHRETSSSAHPEMLPHQFEELIDRLMETRYANDPNDTKGRTRAWLETKSYDDLLDLAITWNC